MKEKNSLLLSERHINGLKKSLWLVAVDSFLFQLFCDIFVEILDGQFRQCSIRS